MSSSSTTASSRISPLKDELTEDGFVFTPQTDTEVVAHLIARERREGKTPRDAVAQMLKRLEGAFALAILFQGEHDLMIGARTGAPLAVGHGEGEMYLGSDAIALAPFTNQMTYLEDGDWVVLTRNSIEILDAQGTPVKRPRQQSQRHRLHGRQGQAPPFHGQGDRTSSRK